MRGVWQFAGIGCIGAMSWGCQWVAGFEDHELVAAPDGGGASSIGGAGGTGGEDQGGRGGGGAPSTGGTGAGGSSTEGYCGDGVIQRGEQCDDGANQSDDGCSSECMVECNEAVGEVLRPGTMHCYRHDGEARTWFAARDSCVDWGGTLAEITSLEEDNFIISSLAISASAWIGVNDADGDGTYRWPSGAELGNYDQFADGIEEAKCGVHESGLSWYVFDCDYLGKPSVCERSTGLSAE